MQNKPNLLNAQMNVIKVLRKDYENVPLRRRGENKPNQTQFQRQKNAAASGTRYYIRIDRVNSLSYLLSTVTPGQSSVRNGEAGKPSLLYKLHTGLSAQA